METEQMEQKQIYIHVLYVGCLHSVPPSDLTSIYSTHGISSTFYAIPASLEGEKYLS